MRREEKSEEKRMRREEKRERYDDYLMTRKQGKRGEALIRGENFTEGRERKK